MKPGDKILEAKIAGELDVSRTPVREAMVELVKEGLLVFLPRKGTYVRCYSKNEYLEIYDVREVLEGLAVRLVCENRSEGILEDLERINRKLREICEKLPARTKGKSSELFDQFREFDIEFHRTIIVKSGNSFLTERIAALYFIIESLVIAYEGPYVERFHKATDEHDKIIIQLRTCAPELCEQAIRDHIRDAKEYFDKNVESRIGA